MERRAPLPRREIGGEISALDFQSLIEEGSIDPHKLNLTGINQEISTKRKVEIEIPTGATERPLYIVNAGTRSSFRILHKQTSGQAFYISSRSTGDAGVMYATSAVANDKMFVRLKQDTGTNDFWGLQRNDDVNQNICIRIGVYRIWIDSDGDLRLKSANPTSDTDGVVVGSQS